MNIDINFQGICYQADLSKPILLALPIQDGQKGFAFGAEPLALQALYRIAKGDSVNATGIVMNIHDHGTHTENFAHIAPDIEPIHLEKYHFFAQVIQVNVLQKGELFILEDTVLGEIQNGVEALVFVSESHQFHLEEELASELEKRGICHILLSTTSIDPIADGGKLLAHKAFFSHKQGGYRKNATITELIRCQKEMPEGLYLLNLQVLLLQAEASPSNPVLYALTPKK